MCPQTLAPGASAGVTWIIAHFSLENYPTCVIGNIVPEWVNLWIISDNVQLVPFSPG